MTVSYEAVFSITKPFFDEDPGQPVFLSVCCDRVYVGRLAPTMCRTCPKIPSPIKVQTLDDLEQAVRNLSP